ncbi:phosphoethanolamine transferase [Wenyingzhuangia sp. IMCC45467]
MTFKKRYKGLALAVLSILLFFILEQVKYGVFKRRMPYIAVFEATKYFNKEPFKYVSVEQNLKTNNKVNIVFVLGESVRAKNMQLNGYQRETNPLLSKRTGVSSINNLYTPNTYTAKSVPQILTSQSINNSVNKDIYSIYTVLNKANYNTIWIGNQTPEISYRDLINQNKEISLIDVEHSVLSYNKKLDGELLTIFKNRYKKNQANFYTIHMIGSHWWYESRYPKEFQKFKPIVKTKYLPSNTKEEMINSYDNTIVYLDYFLENIISFLEKKQDNTILIYLSDHGEILGEDGKWLHAQDHEASKNPACLIWYSKTFEEKYKYKIDNLKSNLKSQVTTDFLYHSILDIIEVQEFKYNTNKSIFSINP